MTTAETEPRAQAPGEMVGLITMTVFAVIGAIVLAIVAAVGANEYTPSESDIATAAAASWWSGFLLTVAVLSFIATLVLAGVRRMLAAAGFFV